MIRPDGADRSLVLTMDVITPIVDDPFAFGAIAAANSLSDVYAMGGRADVALSFIGCPTDKLPPGTLGEIVRGLNDACTRAKCVIVGGHTMKDTEPKCGLAVVGSVEPDAIWSQCFAQPGDVLVLSKAIGTGLVGQSVRAGNADPKTLQRATAQMMALNDVACEVGRACGAHACTDITGFGLLGHLRNLVEASQVVAELHASAVPLLDGVLQLAADGCVPGGSRRNLSYAEKCTAFADEVDEPLRLALADAQTSGGLLLALPADRATEAVQRLHDAGVDDAAAIGTIVEEGPGRIKVME